jgi:hypothetical protein
MIIGQGKVHHLETLAPDIKLGHYGNAYWTNFHFTVHDCWPVLDCMESKNSFERSEFGPKRTKERAQTSLGQVDDRSAHQRAENTTLKQCQRFITS